MKRLIFGSVLTLALGSVVTPAHAGNIVLTGHDDDYHCGGGSTDQACVQLASLIKYAAAGSSLPVLTFDAGSELTSDLTSLGIKYFNVNPDLPGAVTASLFDHSTYGAFVVASDSSCGGCDNDPGGEAAIAAQGKAIGDFLNAGGGIVGLAGADSSNYYAFVPQTATSVGGAPSDGYSATAAGTAAGIPTVNGDPTHNLFYNPGTNGESNFYQIAEVNDTTGNGVIMPPAAVTLICTDCTVSGGVITGGGGGGGTSVTPEPSSIFLLGSGLAGAAGMMRRRFQSRS